MQPPDPPVQLELLMADNLTYHPASRYDEEVGRTIPYYDAIHRECLAFVESLPRPPRTWLDTGCGTGTLVARAMPLFPQTEFVVADPSAAMLSRARERLSSSRVEIVPPCSTSALPLNPARFDLVTAIQCHHYLDRAGRRAAISTCYDLLTPGGLFITSENIRPRSATGTGLGLRYWRRYQERAGRAPAEVAAHIARFDREYFPITIDEHLALYGEVGFQVVDLLWCSYLQAVFYAVKGDG
jgi:tRNA (cmo5U34)-methyltransferase